MKNKIKKIMVIIMCVLLHSDSNKESSHEVFVYIYEYNCTQSSN